MEDAKRGRHAFRMTEKAETEPLAKPARSATARHRSRQWRTVNRPILATVVFTFAAYMMVGLPLAVLPPFVRGPLGFSSVLAGLAVSTQYLATFITRAPVGRLTDSVGPKHIVMFGLAACAGSGVLTALGGLFQSHHVLSLVLLLGRLCLGTGESAVSTGGIAWAIGKVGATHSAKVISWNGIATYGGISLGAPLGVLIQSVTGFSTIGVAVVVVGLAALPFAAAGPITRLVTGPRMSFGSVFGRILPYGAALALSSIGFGAIASFITLFYASRHWGHAALALSAFGGCFILARLIFVGSIARQGGNRVALASFLVECCGLALLWRAGDPVSALIGAGLAGFGFALVFPALGVEVLARVPSTSRGAAIGAFSVFPDVALCVTGPLAGFIVGSFGYATIFLVAALAAGIAAVILVMMGALRRPASR
jgi:MFS family permease